jgi:hypothetical protein
VLVGDIELKLHTLVKTLENRKIVQPYTTQVKRNHSII